MSVWAPVSATAWIMTSAEVVAWPIWGLNWGWFVGLWTLRRAYVFSWSQRATRIVGEGACYGCLAELPILVGVAELLEVGVIQASHDNWVYCILCVGDRNLACVAGRVGKSVKNSTDTIF